MKQAINLGDKMIVLLSKDCIDELDMDQVTSIDHSNVYGEIATCSVLLNKIGGLRAEAESIYSSKKLECDIYEANLKKRLRKRAALEGGKLKLEDGTIKFTEGTLSELILLDEGFQQTKKNLIEHKKNLDFIESLYWSIQSKDRKLNNLVPKVTPEEFYNDLVEGTINTFTIKKLK